MATQPTLDGPRLPPASGGKAKALVMFLHGYGSNGADLIGLVPYWQDAMPDVAWIAPNAPQRVPGAPDGYQWRALPAPPGADALTAMRPAAALVDDLIDAELAAHGLAEDRLVLVGFSQGTMMSLFVAPRRERRIAGVIGFSGNLTAPEVLAQELKSRPPIVLVHGSHDPVIPAQATMTARDALRGLGFEVDAYIAPGVEHSIDPLGMAVGEQFLKRVLR